MNIVPQASFDAEMPNVPASSSNDNPFVLIKPIPIRRVVRPPLVTLAQAPSLHGGVKFEVFKPQPMKPAPLSGRILAQGSEAALRFGASSASQTEQSIAISSSNSAFQPRKRPSQEVVDPSEARRKHARLEARRRDHAKVEATRRNAIQSGFSDLKKLLGEFCKETTPGSGTQETILVSAIERIRCLSSYIKELEKAQKP